MDKENALVVFEDKKIRRFWDESDQKWFYSIVDIVYILTDSVDPGAYWRKLKERLKAKGNQTVTNCHTLKMMAVDGRMRETDVADTSEIFRLIQSIPSPKAEPFKLWLAKVGYQRIQEIQNPELIQKRMIETFKQKGYSDPWIEKRVRGIAIRDELTGEWKKRGIKDKTDFSILTAEISKATFDMTPSEYKDFKGLKKENLRDHMTDIELIFSMLGESVTKEITVKEDPREFPKAKAIAKRGGGVAGIARKATEKELGRKISTKDNYLTIPEKQKRLMLKNPKPKKKRIKYKIKLKSEPKKKR